MKTGLKQIIDFLGSQILSIKGEIKDLPIKYLKSADETDQFTLDWISLDKTEKQLITEKSKGIAILVDNSVIYSETIINQGKILIYVENPKVALSKVGNHFFAEKIVPGIDPGANIHHEAKLGKNVYIGFGCSIGECEIGDDSVIHPNVSICNNVKLGKNVIVHSGSVLGADGFGYERDENGNLFKFPQLSKLIIGNHVEIGANTCIDRGALKDTVIGNYTKINNLCHIAHNVSIGKNVVITGQVNVSGSTTIEDDVWIAPNATVRGFLLIGKGSTIGMGAVVTRDVPPGETWVGNPARKFK